MTTKPKVYKIDGAAFDKIMPIYQAGLDFAARAAREQAALTQKHEAECKIHHDALWDAVRLHLDLPAGMDVSINAAGAEAGVLLVRENVQGDRQIKDMIAAAMKNAAKVTVMDLDDLDGLARTDKPKTESIH